MSRFRAFVEEFLSSISPWQDVPAKAKVNWSRVVWLCGLLGIPSVATLVEWAEGFVLAHLFYFSIPLGVCIVWKMAVAWYKTRGSVIALGKLDNDRASTFYLPIRNSGAGEVVARAYATNVEGSPNILQSIELQWNGVDAEQPMRLAGSREGYASILFVTLPESGNPVVSVCSKAERGRTPSLVPLSADAPLERQSPLILTVRVEFQNSDGTFVSDTTRRIVITPDRTSPLFYTLVVCN